MTTGRIHYRARLPRAPGDADRWLADSARWDGFEFRRDDIVISAPAKSGTTWTQMICALLVFQAADLPTPLTTLSPWLDMRVRPISEVREQLAAQRHRRFIKTHTPLDGVPQAPGVTYIAVGRDPRDVAISLHHHQANLAKETLRRLLDPSTEPAGPPPAPPASERETFLRWLADDESPREYQYSLRALINQQRVAWSLRNDPDVVLVHYDDLGRDLGGQMRRLADRLQISVAAETWPALIEAATFDQMRERSDQLTPDERLGLIKDPRRFFRRGRSGGWRDHLTDDDLAWDEKRLAALAPPDLARWLHHGSLGE
jgi:aryl sulfotransferase